MNKREAEQYNHMMDTLRSLGFERDECEQLRRISMTLHRWHERECGDSDDGSSRCITRGRKENGEFVYDDNGKPFEEVHYHSENKARYYRIPDRETGARKRLLGIINARAKRIGVCDVTAHIQGDPRGAALYILRPGDVPAGAEPDAYYSRGVCVY